MSERSQSRHHYEEVAQRFEELRELHEEVADLLDLAPVQKHVDSDHILAEAERRTAETCGRVADSIRSRLHELRENSA